MNVKPAYPLFGLVLIAEQSIAGISAGTPVPMEMGGIAAAAAISLIIATQLIKRRK